MEFKINRASSYSTLEKKKSPCDGAFLKDVDVIQVRTLPSFEQFDKKFGNYEGTWLSKGIDHKINKQGYIQRTLPKAEQVWVVEVSSLDELLKLVSDEGSIVFDTGRITIYDDYLG